MEDDLAKLTPATPENLQEALAFALRFNGKKRYHQADGQPTATGGISDVMARAAVRLDAIGRRFRS